MSIEQLATQIVAAVKASGARGDAKHRTMVRNCAPEIPESPGLVLLTIPE